MNERRDDCTWTGTTSRATRTTARRWALLLGLAGLVIVPFVGHAEDPVVIYTPNMRETTPFGPAPADIVVLPSNFVPCNGGPIALCYYSGPNDPSKGGDLSCTVTEDGDFANCKCVEINRGPYFVDINAILDDEVYLETVATCGPTGSECKGIPNMAPVCEAIQRKRFLANASPPPDTISTFSLALEAVPQYQIGQTNCDPAPYAGCMTAPCVKTDETVEICDVWGEAEVCGPVPVNECACPIVPNSEYPKVLPYQVGQTGAECNIGSGQTDDNIWSAAYNPAGGVTSPFECTPDAPGESGCPLLSPIPDVVPLEPYLPAKPENISCETVCQEYRDSERPGGVEVGFTCDAVLCTTSTVKDVDLVEDACSGLGDGTTSEILKLEVEVGCSCCASQICHCPPSPKTNAKIFELNEQQRLAGHPPQCDSNGSLCGKPRSRTGLTQNGSKSPTRLGFPTTRGWSFTTTAQVLISELGFWDSGPEGLDRAHQVGLWTSDGTLLRSVVVPRAFDAELREGFRWAAVDPIALEAGQSYVIAAELPRSNDRNLRKRDAIDLEFHPDISFGQGVRSLNVPGLNYPRNPETSNGNTILNANFRAE